MPALSCSAMTCVYNQNELCSKGDIRVGGSGAKSSMETCCESFKERGEGTMSNSTGCGCTKIGVDCKAQNCTFNDNCKCEAGDIHIAGDSACSCQETECSSFRCGCGKKKQKNTKISIDNRMGECYTAIV